MKKLIALFVFVFTAAAAMAQLTTAKDLQVTSSIKIADKKMNGISDDTSKASARANYLITERAAKRYADSVKRRLYLGYLLQKVNDSTIAVDSTRLDSALASHGGGGGGTLQSVTTAGDTTDKDIIVNYGGVTIASMTSFGGSGYKVGNFLVRDSRTITGNGFAELNPSQLKWSGVNGATSTLYFTNNPTSSGILHNVRLPITSTTGDGAIRTLLTQVNGQYAGTDGNVSIPLPWDISGSDVYYNTGNVGIGTTTPDSAKLVVKGGIITDSIRIGDDWFYTKKITLTPADVYTLNSVPVLAIDAPGTGKAVEIISASARLLYNTTPYDTDATLVLKSVNTITQITSLSFLSIATVGTQFQIGSYTDSFNENSPISITSDQDNSTGDSDLNIYIHYRVVNL